MTVRMIFAAWDFRTLVIRFNPVMRTETWRPSVVVAMPCYDEEGIADFIDEIHEHLAPHVRSLGFVVVDDCSPTLRPQSLLKPHHAGHVRVESNLQNLGHGPTVMNAYAYALAMGSDVVVHVDGDGQFSGGSVLAVVQRLADADIALGERGDRPESWYRSLVSSMLSATLRRRSGVVRDVNTPLRAYRHDALATLHKAVSPLSVVPHVMLTLRMSTAMFVVATVPVHSRQRLGHVAVGTMWGTPRWSPFLPSRRFLAFCLRAAAEVALTGDGRQPPPQLETIPVRAA